MPHPYYQHNGYTVWQGDVLDVLADMPSSSVDLVATSPPYNCRKAYDAMTDEQPWPQYYEWIRAVLVECYRVLRRGGVVAVNVPGVVRYQHDHAYRDTWCDFDPTYQTHRQGKKVMGRGRLEPVGFNLYAMMGDIDPHLREPIVWVKGKSPGHAICSDYRMGSDNNPYMRPAHEMILLGSKQQWYHRGGTGRRGAKAVPFLDYTKDVWYIPPTTNAQHPATWPVEIPKRLIRLFVHAGDGVVLDPFMGVGTTLQAARGLGIQAIGIDISEGYCNIATDALRQQPLWDDVDIAANARGNAAVTGKLFQPMLDIDDG